MRNLDFSHLYSNAVGFERMARELEGLFDQKAAAYPPYNIEKRVHDGYRITVAVAGFEREELELVTWALAAARSATCTASTAV